MKLLAVYDERWPHLYLREYGTSESDGTEYQHGTVLEDVYGAEALLEKYERVICELNEVEAEIDGYIRG